VEAGAESADGDFVYVADFGIARAVDGSGSGSLTSTGTTVGSMDYIAPERFGTGHGDRRADVYALGCVLYEALTAQRPFPVEGLPAIINAHLNTPPPAATALRPDVPTAFDAVIARAMAKDPDDRYPSAGALASDARAALDGAAQAAAPAAPWGTPTTDGVVPVDDAAPDGSAEPPDGDALASVATPPPVGAPPRPPVAARTGDVAPAAPRASHRGGWSRALLAAAAAVVLLAAIAVASLPQLTSVGAPHPAGNVQAAPLTTTPPAAPATTATVAPTLVDAGLRPPAPRPAPVGGDPGGPTDPGGGDLTPPLRIKTRGLPSATVGVPWSATLIATGGESHYTWSLGDHPAWVTLDGDTLSGTPSAAGEVTVTAIVADNADGHASKAFTLTVNPVPTPTVPDVVGQTLSSAVQTLQEAGYTNIAVSGSTDPQAVVVGQDPPGGTPTSTDKPITLTTRSSGGGSPSSGSLGGLLPGN
jgi:Protein kinase domain/PASTA domain